MPGRLNPHLPLLAGIGLCAAAAVANAAPAAADRPATASRSAPVRSGCEYDYAPFSFIDEHGQAGGFSVELLRASLEAVGRTASFRAAPWPALKADLAQGRLQALPQVARTPEREGSFDFTFPYLTMHGTIVVRSETTDIHGPESLRGKRVAVLQEDVAHEYLRRARLGAVIVPLPSFASALRELSAGKHDAVVIQKLLAFQIMKEANLANLRVVGPPLADYSQVLCFAVRKGDRGLLSELNEGLSIVLANGTFRRLHAQWFSSLEALGRTRSRIVVGGDDSYPPYEFLDQNGQPTGFSVELTRAIARHMELSVDVHLAPWNRIRERLARGQIDVVNGMFYSAERDRQFDFSPPHSLVQHVIVVRRGSAPIADMQDLAGKSVLVMSGDIMHDLAAARGRALRLVEVDTQEQALLRLAAGEQDAALVAKVPALYWIEKHGIRNLLVSERPVLSAEYSYAVSAGNDVLLEAFTEGLATVKRTGEYRALQAKWLSPYEHSGIGPWTVARYVLIGAVPVTVLLLGSLLWSRSLRAQVRRRTEELQRETEALRVSQQHLEQAQEALLQADGRKNEFLAILSHELRNPLAPIRSSLYVLEHAPPGADAARRAQAIVSSQVEQLVRLVDDLLDVTRIERGKIRLCRERLELNELVRQTVEDHRALFDESGVRLELATAPEPVFISGDASRLAQVLGNLLQNAAKFTPPGGTTTVAIRTEPAPDTVVLAVADTGVGVTQEALSHLFEPFMQAHATLDRSKGGLGLGLALVKGLVELHGGEVSARSGGPGSGAEFLVRLPRDTRDKKAANEAQRGTEPLRLCPSRILIVEDNVAAATSLRDALELRGHTVTVAHDGVHALAAARAFRPEIVLCDLGLPGMSGYEVAAALRRDQEVAPAVLVAVSGYALPEDQQRSSEAGFDLHLAKPVHLERLESLLAARRA